MSEDTREIVSLRDKENGQMTFGHVTSEQAILDGNPSNNWIFVDDTKYRKNSYHIHRNLAAMPHEDFGRKCKGSTDREDYYLHHAPGHYTEYCHVVGKTGIKDFDYFSSVTFLDDIPKIYEIDGKKYDKS